jgi:phosphatidylinositol alpha-1,6-mannosyltransferase
MSSVFLACDCLDATNSGIARVARLMARSLVERDYRLAGLVLHGSTDGFSFPVRSASRSQSRVLARALFGQWANSHAIYDSAGPARAHGWIPFVRRPMLTWLHGIEVWKEIGSLKKVAVCAAASVLLSNSAYTRNRAGDWDERLRQATVCWLATETDDPVPQLDRTGPPRVTIFSRVDADSYKGHPELIRAWPAVRAAVPDAVLCVAGKGPGLTQYQKLAAETGLPDSAFEFPGFIPEETVDDLWRKTTVFAMPSRGEGFGLVYIEAMRWGIPVIASVHDAGGEVNADGESGYNVTLDHASELTERIIHLLRNPDTAAKLGDGGRQRWATYFRYSAFRERFTPILEKFLSL